MDPLAINSQLRALSAPLQPILPKEIPDPISGPAAAEKADGKSFTEILADSIGEVNALHADADQAVRDLSSGKSNDLHTTMIAMQKAEMSMRLLVEVRNKVITAYQEIMRIQV